jgi:hypothetical protein
LEDSKQMIHIYPGMQNTTSFATSDEEEEED